MDGRRATGRAGGTKLVHEIEEAIAQVQREPAPDPFAEEWRAISTKHLSEGHE